jgi:ubiquinone/menaquinone biosynthesis C-methylase UbiE
MQSRIEFIFDQVARNASSKKKDIASIKAVLEDCEFQGKTVLEVGCGIGDNLIYCAQNGAGYAEGFDISGESIKLAKSKVGSMPNIVFHRASIEAYKTERKFDFVIAWGVFEYFADSLESLKKMRCFLTDKGTMILLISRPIFIKKVSFLCRMALSKIPLKSILPVVKLIAMVLKIFNSAFKRVLYTGESSTYTMEQTILEALMVPRYNIFHSRIFTDYLKNEGFSVEFINGVAHSMVGMVAKNGKEKQYL